MTNYYYILSSMPLLSLDKRPKEDELDEAIDLIKRQLSENDLEAFNWFLFRNDLYNLIEYWQHHFQGLLHRSLRKPYGLSREKLANLKASPEDVPPFLQDWYDAYKDLIPHWSTNQIELALNELFFSEVKRLEKGFVRDYFLFEMELRKQMAYFHQSRYSFLSKVEINSNSPLYADLRRDPLQLSATLLQEYPHLQEILSALQTKDPTLITRAVHQVLWQKADALCEGHYYDIHALLSYTAKLFLLYRREQLASPNKRDRLGVLRQEALQNFKQND